MRCVLCSLTSFIGRQSPRSDDSIETKRGQAQHLHIFRRAKPSPKWRALLSSALATDVYEVEDGKQAQRERPSERRE